MNDQLSAIGDALQRAVAADLEHRRRRRWRSPRVGVAVMAAVVAVPAVAYAATNLLTDSQVAASLPQGTKALIGTDPTCTVVTANVEYHCVLASAPSDGGPVQSQVTAGPDGTIKVVVAGDGQTKSELIHATSLKDYAHLLAQARALAKSQGSGTVTVTTAPSGGIPTPATNWTGTVEATVDASRHVNGGCRALNASGTSWECYIGEAAVTQGIISQGFLGQYAPVPGVG